MDFECREECLLEKQIRADERPKAFANGYESGYKQGRADAIDEFKKEMMELSNRRFMHDIYSDDIVDIADMLKEQNNE